MFLSSQFVGRTSFWMFVPRSRGDRLRSIQYLSKPYYNKHWLPLLKCSTYQNYKRDIRMPLGHCTTIFLVFNIHNEIEERITWKTHSGITVLWCNKMFLIFKTTFTEFHSNSSYNLVYIQIEKKLVLTLRIWRWMCCLN